MNGWDGVHFAHRIVKVAVAQATIVRDIFGEEAAAQAPDKIAGTSRCQYGSCIH
ncbi:hypothetical protein [Sporosarcina sp. NCCP-2222]|uniref:hypothetical protein n=1 Tax=Sporosarcina sp. NCCP-2222 TaxID=2935073 RepID=UPI0020BFCF79|nr:hypothetical protein [Sporosarcina sp. NCCP-2222]